MSNKSSLPKEYELLDSGNLQKLERFGSKILLRPSKTAVWKPNLSISEWNKADGQFMPLKGWRFNKEPFETWTMNLPKDIKLSLNLQINGQIGFFPEHHIYLSSVATEIERLKNKIGAAPRVLNLFAYTGMASCFCAKHLAETTHVELSKRCLTWARENFELNRLPEKSIRTIQDDALYFIQKEAQKNHKYEIIIADPPNFSRISKTKEWNLEKILPRMIETLAKLVNPQGYAIFLTTHMTQTAPQVFSNLFDDYLDKGYDLKTEFLLINEHNTKRSMPYGHLTYISK